MSLTVERKLPLSVVWSIIVALVAGVYYIVTGMDDLKIRVVGLTDATNRNTEEQKSIRTELVEIKLQNAKDGVSRETLSDHEARIRDIERRLK